MVSLLHFANSTEAKIRNATNSDPLGPYNKQLLDILVLSYNHKSLKVITSNLSKRISTLLDKNESKGPLGRSNSINKDKVYLTVLKSLSVIIYLLEYGSELFITWLNEHYERYIHPLFKVKVNFKFEQPIKSKLLSIKNYHENSLELKNLRTNLSKLRQDLSKPGVVEYKSSPIPDNLQSYNYSYKRSSKSLDLPRPQTTSFGGLPPLAEESSLQHSNSFQMNSLNNPFQMNNPNNPFQMNSLNNPFQHSNNPFISN